MPAETHDQAVALVSHVPQLVSSLLAARLIQADSAEIALAGQGLRDTTRIAASDPSLWIQILSANHQSVAEILREFQRDLGKVINALDDPSQPGALAVINGALEAGNRGVERIPGKHGTKATAYAQVVAMIDDRPGQFAKLLTDIGEIGINLEDVKLEHSPGAQIGLVEIYVLPEVETELVSELASRGWRIAG
jgi:prephenate dehydrogenase